MRAEPVTLVSLAAEVLQEKLPKENWVTKDSQVCLVDPVQPG